MGIRDSLRAAKRLQALKGGGHDVLRVVGAQALGADITDAGGLHDSADGTAGDDTGTGGSGLQEHAAGAELADDLVGNGGAGQAHRCLLYTSRCV